MSRTIYVGNLPLDVDERELEDLFYKFGRIVEIDLKLPPRPPGFAFITFEDTRDAEDAIDRRDRYDFDGRRLRVEMARGRGGDRRDGGRGGDRGGRRERAKPKRFDLCVEVENLPKSCSWQDLKDYMRKAGEVVFADVYRSKRGDWKGIVEYEHYDDMKYALNKLHDTEFKNPYDQSHIKVYRFEDSPRGGSRSKSPSKSRSRSRSPRSRSRSRSRSKSPNKSPIKSQSPKEAEPLPESAKKEGMEPEAAPVAEEAPVNE